MVNDDANFNWWAAYSSDNKLMNEQNTDTLDGNGYDKPFKD